MVQRSLHHPTALRWTRAALRGPAVRRHEDSDSPDADPKPCSPRARRVANSTRGDDDAHPRPVTARVPQGADAGAAGPEPGVASEDRPGLTAAQRERPHRDYYRRGRAVDALRGDGAEVRPSATRPRRTLDRRSGGRGRRVRRAHEQEPRRQSEKHCLPRHANAGSPTLPCRAERPTQAQQYVQGMPDRPGSLVTAAELVPLATRLRCHHAPCPLQPGQTGRARTLPHVCEDR